MRGVVLAVALSACLPGTGAAQATPLNRRILGRWQGASLCVKAAWNTACRNERVIYHVARAAHDTSRITLQAGKRVGSATVSMGDLEFRFDQAAGSWVAEVATGRGRVVWSLRVDGDRLIGQLVEMPSGRRMRNVTAVRDSA